MAHDRGRTMRAVMWEGQPYHMAVRDAPMPEIEAPEDVIVRMTLSGICGSDLHTYHGLLGGNTVPYIMGHEGVGVVVEVGRAVTTLKPGDKVIGSLAGFEFNPDDTENDPVAFLGFGDSFGPSLPGLQAEYVRFPLADNSLVKINDTNSIDDFNFINFSDIFVTAWSGLSWSGFRAGESVAVFGAGPVGLLCAYSALLRGASKVFVVDHVRDRLNQAASMGAVPIDFSNGTPASEQILAQIPQGVHRAVDCCGQVALNGSLKPQQNYILEQAVHVCRQFGGIGLVGPYLSAPNSEGTPLGSTMSPALSFPTSEFWIKALSIRGGSVSVQDFSDNLPVMLDLVQSGRAKPGFVVSAEIGIESAPRFYERFDKKLETKVVIRFPWDMEKYREEIGYKPTTTASKLAGGESDGGAARAALSAKLAVINRDTKRLSLNGQSSPGLRSAHLHF